MRRCTELRGAVRCAGPCVPAKSFLRTIHLRGLQRGQRGQRRRIGALYCIPALKRQYLAAASNTANGTAGLVPCESRACSPRRRPYNRPGALFSSTLHRFQRREPESHLLITMRCRASARTDGRDDR
ncbi:hypothetical protein MRX96_039729 [Rhipicephalus microplus]